MANIELYFPKVFKYEGGYVEDKTDAGGATNMGVTLGTWQQMGYDKNHDGHIDKEDIKILSKEDAMLICKKHYWDTWKADEIINQKVAEQLVDWVWCSGAWGIKIPQRILKLTEDGNVGPATLAEVNKQDGEAFAATIKAARLAFVNNICKNNPTQNKYLKGWMIRINTLTF